MRLPDTIFPIFVLLLVELSEVMRDCETASVWLCRECRDCSCSCCSCSQPRLDSGQHSTGGPGRSWPLSLFVPVSHGSCLAVTVTSHLSHQTLLQLLQGAGDVEITISSLSYLHTMLDKYPVVGGERGGWGAPGGQSWYYRLHSDTGSGSVSMGATIHQTQTNTGFITFISIILGHITGLSDS